VVHASSRRKRKQVARTDSHAFWKIASARASIRDRGKERQRRRQRDRFTDRDTFIETELKLDRQRQSDPDLLG
jgi:hypothetical protein